jgi:hypothetical protein
MKNYNVSAPTPPHPEPGEQSPEAPKGDPLRGPPPEPWHNPGPPTKKVNLPPDSPSPGIIVPPPSNPMIS